MVTVAQQHTGCSFCLFSSECIFLLNERTCHVRFVFARSSTVIKHTGKLLYFIGKYAQQSRLSAVL